MKRTKRFLASVISLVLVATMLVSFASAAVDTDIKNTADIQAVASNGETERYEFENATMKGSASSATPNENVSVASTSNGKVAKFASGSNDASYVIEIENDGTYEVKFVAVGLGSYSRNIQFYVDGNDYTETLPHTNWTEFTYTVELSKGTHTIGARANGSWGWQWEWSYIDYAEVKCIEAEVETEVETDTVVETETDTTVETDTAVETEIDTDVIVGSEIVKYEFEDAIMEGNTTISTPTENVSATSTSNGKVAKFQSGANKAYFNVNAPIDGTYTIKFVAVGLGSADRNIQFYIDGNYNTETVSHNGWTEFVYEVELTAGEHKIGAKADGSWGWQWEWSYIDYMEITMPVVETETDTETEAETDTEEVVEYFNFTYGKVMGEGTVTGTQQGSYPAGTVITVTAVPAEHYEFWGWNTPGNPSLLHENTYSFTLTEDTNIIAVFKALTYPINLIVTEGGSAYCNNGIASYNETVTATATADEGYEFIGWSNKYGEIISTDAEYTFVVTGIVTLYANFKAIETETDTEEVEYFNFTYSIEGNRGTVTGTPQGSYPSGTVITVTATPNEHYKFWGWNISGVYGLTLQNPYTFTLEKDTKINVIFQDVYYDIILDSSEGGVAECNYSSATYNQTITATATADTGYKFIGWSKTKGGEIISTEAVYSFTALGEITLYANFEKAEDVLFTYSFVGNGKVTGSEQGYYPVGTEITVTAVEDDKNFKFVGWSTSSNGEIFHTNPTYTFVITERTSLYAIYERIEVKEYTFTLRTAEFGGSISSNLRSGTYPEGTSATVKAVPDELYRFVGWKVSGQSELVTEDPYTFTITGNITIQPVFELKPTEKSIIITGDNNPANSWTNNDNGSSLDVTSNSIDYTYNNHGTLKLEYTINLNNQYGGYAGRQIAIDADYTQVENANGIGFWYLTPVGFDGQIALCLQSNAVGLDDLVQLTATNGEWKYFFYGTNKTNLADMTLYINGSKNGYTTTATTSSYAEGTLYIAEMAVVFDEVSARKNSIMSKNEAFLNDAQQEEFRETLDKMTEGQLILYDNLANNFVNNEYHGGESGAYYSTLKKIIMDIDLNSWEDSVNGKEGAWQTKFHEEGHQLDNLLGINKCELAKRVDSSYYCSDITNTASVFGSKLSAAIQQDVIDMVNKAIDWQNSTYGGDYSYVTDISQFNDGHENVFIRWLIQTYNTSKKRAQIAMVTDAVGLATKGVIHPYAYGFWGHDYDYRQRGLNSATSETWATFISLEMGYANEEATEICKSLMPKTWAVCEEGLEVAIEFSKTNSLDY